MFRFCTTALLIGAVSLAPRPAGAQADPHAQHQQEPPRAAAAWRLMQDGVVHGLFNHQGGPRGGTELVVPNWWMGMATRESGRHTAAFTAMLSLDPATVGRAGYRELFQVGESLDDEPLVDRQHPHDFVMQLAASWRVSLGERSSLTLSGGPAGEPTIGPVAFMHRRSASGLPLAPLGHHTFDSTHISFGVVTAAFEHGPIVIEGSVFNGREPDEHRWDFDFGPMDSYAARLWLRPAPEWELQVSSAYLREPEALEPDDIRRTTASASWQRESAGAATAATMGAGVNAAHGTTRTGVFGEMLMERGAWSASGRLEWQQLETDVLLGHGHAHDDEPETTAASPEAAVTALTVGVGRRVGAWRGFEGAVQAQAVVYRVPAALRETHGAHPVSFQVLFSLRLPTGAMGRMWGMRMSQPSAGHRMDEHAGHVMR